MSYMRCPTCGRVLANKYVPYELGLQKILESDKTNEQKIIDKSNLIKELKLSNPCCTMRLMTYNDLSRIVK